MPQPHLISFVIPAWNEESVLGPTLEAVSAAARGQGLARRLYNDLEQVARQGGHERLVCEINAEPPNPKSDAFHRRLGFVLVGEQFLESYGRRVRYWAKELR